MAINYSTPVKNARLQAVLTELGNNGVLVIGTSALSGSTGVLASLTLASPAGTINNGVLTFSGMPRNATASATGTAALAELRTSGGTVIASGLTVGTSNADVIINATAVSSGQTIQITSGVINHA